MRTAYRRYRRVEHGAWMGSSAGNANGKLLKGKSDKLCLFEKRSISQHVKGYLKRIENRIEDAMAVSMFKYFLAESIKRKG
jgi:hypothetical protein